MPDDSDSSQNPVWDCPDLLEAPKGCPSPLQEAYGLVADAVFRAWETRNAPLSGLMFKEAQAHPLSDAWQKANHFLTTHETQLRCSAGEAFTAFQEALADVERINHAAGQALHNDAPSYMRAQLDIDAGKLLNAMRESTCQAAFRLADQALDAESNDESEDEDQRGVSPDSISGIPPAPAWVPDWSTEDQPCEAEPANPYDFAFSEAIRCLHDTKSILELARHINKQDRTGGVLGNYRLDAYRLSIGDALLGLRRSLHVAGFRRSLPEIPQGQVPVAQSSRRDSR